MGDLNKHAPKVSVVIPCYNCESVVGETIDSVMNQDYPNIEIIAVNDGSTDYTKKILQEYGDNIQYLEKKNGGLASARNYGMKHARGEFVVWLDADDIMERNKISCQLSVMDKLPNIGICCTDFSAFNNAGIFEESHIRSYYSSVARSNNGFSEIYESVISLPDCCACTDSANIRKNISVYHGNVFIKMLWGNIIHPPTVMIRKSVIAKAGDLDPKLKEGTDYEYFVRIRKLVDVAYIDAPLLRYRYSDHQMSSDKNLASIWSSAAAVMETFTRLYPDEVVEHRQKFTQRMMDVYVRAAKHNAKHHMKKTIDFATKAMKYGCRSPYLVVIVVIAIMPVSFLNFLKTCRSKFRSAA